MPHPIRRIKPSEGVALRTIRLRALVSDPGAFDSSYERESPLPTEEWERRAAVASTGGEQCLFVFDTPDGFVGMAGGYTPVDRPSVRRLYGMWVAPEARSAGIGAQLIDAITSWGREVGADAVQLWVVDTNLAARRLYERVGFVDTEVNQPLPSNPTVTETLMQLGL